jgi:hypothetical protein
MIIITCQSLSLVPHALLGQKKSLGRPDDLRLARRRWSSTKAADKSAARHARAHAHAMHYFGVRARKPAAGKRPDR